MDSLYPIILTEAENQSEGETEDNFSEETIVCGNGRDGFCCGIMNDPQKIAKGKVCRNGRDDFCCGEQSLMMDLFFLWTFFLISRKC